MEAKEKLARLCRLGRESRRLTEKYGSSEDPKIQRTLKEVKAALAGRAIEVIAE